jgi:MoaA/NifB/PqqE/SkfB family radical SAM enzyme
MAPWRNKPKEFPDKMTAKDLISFLDKELQADDVAEITGGEPTMFPELETLLDWLRERGARVILRTNGLYLSEWRRNYGNLVVVLAKHDSSEDYMSGRKKHLLPQDLVIEGIPEHIRQKEPAKPIFVNDETSPLRTHPFDRMFFITNDGKIRCCPICDEDMGTVREPKLRPYYCCPECSYMLGAWNLVNRLENKFYHLRRKKLLVIMKRFNMQM